MSITVATVALNAADALPLTLESVIHQDFADLEILVLDGMSEDDSPAVLASYADAIHRLEYVEDSGIFDAMNRAAALATKEFILFLNAGDVFYCEHALSRMWSRKRPDADIVYGNHVYSDRGVDTFRAAQAMEPLFDALRRGEIDGRWMSRFPGHQATLTRTALLRALRFDPALRLAADHDVLLRAVAGGAAAQYVDETIVYYMGGGVSARHGELVRLEMNAIYRQHSERPDLVDRFLYGGQSPFEGTSSPASGEILGGLGEEAPPPEDAGTDAGTMIRWAAGSAIVLAAPMHRPVNGVTLHGYSRVPDQGFELFQGGERIARCTLPAGAFRIPLTFTSTIAPGRLVTLLPKKLEPFGAPIPLGLFGVRFHIIEPPPISPVNTRIRFSAGEENERLLASGWWGVEPTHVWSRGATSELRLAATEPVAAVAIRVFGNPSVSAQTVETLLNGQSLGVHPVTADGSRQIRLEVADIWQGEEQENMLVLRPSASARVGADPRELGIALVDVELVGTGPDGDAGGSAA